MEESEFSSNDRDLITDSITVTNEPFLSFRTICRQWQLIEGKTPRHEVQVLIYQWKVGQHFCIKGDGHLPVFQILFCFFSRTLIKKIIWAHHLRQWSSVRMKKYLFLVQHRIKYSPINFQKKCSGSNKVHFVFLDTGDSPPTHMIFPLSTLLLLSSC